MLPWHGKSVPRAGFEPATDPDNNPLRRLFSVFSRVLSIAPERQAELPWHDFGSELMLT
jgi:hypothetical protein